MINKIRFSKKQLMVLNWWIPSSKYYNYEAIICDGAIRSGKTFCMSISFLLWAQKCFNNCSFGICGKTIGSVLRNVIYPLMPHIDAWGFRAKLNCSKNYLEILSCSGINRFYLFGGRDEVAAAHIQGITLAGVFFDEVALQPQSFVEQAIARCSISGSRIWFNCNPESPEHWFFKKWIKEKPPIETLYLHFTMDENLMLDPQIKKRYSSLYSSIFFERFIKGKWTGADGLVYQNFDKRKNIALEMPNKFDCCYISCDYGITNPASFGLWGRSFGVWYRIAEYYYDSARTGVRKTDSEYYEELEKLAGGYNIKAVIVDPSASSFIECIKKEHRFQVIKARNDVLEGISLVSELLQTGKIMISPDCYESIREFSLYEWDKNATRDQPKKQNDHAMDEIRYFALTVLKKRVASTNAGAISLARRTV